MSTASVREGYWIAVPGGSNQIQTNAIPSCTDASIAQKNICVVGPIHLGLSALFGLNTRVNLFVFTRIAAYTIAIDSPISIRVSVQTLFLMKFI